MFFFLPIEHLQISTRAQRQSKAGAVVDTLAGEAGVGVNGVPLRSPNAMWATCIGLWKVDVACATFALAGVGDRFPLSGIVRMSAGCTLKKLVSANDCGVRDERLRCT
jgi:hypothetical protein